MGKNWMRSCLALIFALMVMPSLASADDRPLGMWSLGVANDSFFDLDRGYTSGLSLAFTPTNGAYTISLGQDIYTPDSHSGDQPPAGQHPYAAWLYGRYDYRFALQPQLLLTTSLSLGTTGDRAQGKESQDFAHQVLDFNEYSGWDSQISERWGWIAALKGEWQLSLWSHRSFGVDFISLLEGRAGNIQTDGQAGGTLRFGKNLPVLSARWQPVEKSSFYFVVGGFRRWVDKNVFLEGVSNDDYRVEPERAVNTLKLGVHWRNRNVQVDLDLFIPEQEFKDQRYSYRYGLLTLSYWY